MCGLRGCHGRAIRRSQICCTIVTGYWSAALLQV